MSQTVTDYATGTPVYRILGGGGGGGDSATAESMTTAERTSITPDAGFLIWDTDMEKLFVGDGATAGGVEIEGGGGTVTGIEAAVNGGTATILTTGGTGSVKFVGVSGTTISSNGSGEIEIAGGGGGGGGGDISYATVKDMMTGSGASKALNVQTFRGALTSGKAVDVTSKPDGFVGENYRGTFAWTDSTLGFSSFPKFASGLKYFLIADITYVSSMDDDTGSVTPYGGTWLDGTTSPITLDAGKKTRVAILFSSASVRFQFVYAVENDQLIVSNLREYEVTGCSTESVSYISTIEDPDLNYNDFYLIDTDEVNPWVPYIDMGTSPQVTIASGLSYKLNAQTGVHTLSVDMFPSGTYGRDSHIELWVGAEGSVVFAPPLNLLSPLTPNAVHNITVKFRDGQANAYVDDTDVGYVVTITSGSSPGSLYYGLVNSGTHVVFAASTDGVTVDMSGATVASEKRVIGNGHTSTFIGGAVTASANLYMNQLTIAGGSVSIASGATATLEYGRFAPDAITGYGKLVFGMNATLDMTDNTSSAPVAPNGGVVFNDITEIIYGASGATTTATIEGATVSQILSGGTFSCAPNAVKVSSGNVRTFSSATFINPNGGVGIFQVYSGGTLTMTGVTGGNVGAQARCIDNQGGVVQLSGCTMGAGAGVTNFVDGGVVELAGSNNIGRGIGSYPATISGSVTIADNATINLSGGIADIKPGGTITFGANVTIINNAGTSSLLNGGEAGSCSKINTNGTIE